MLSSNGNFDYPSTFGSLEGGEDYALHRKKMEVRANMLGADDRMKQRYAIRKSKRTYVPRDLELFACIPHQWLLTQIAESMRWQV